MDHIIVATDFSTRSDRAIRRATLIAKRTGASLSMVHVVDSDQPSSIIEAQRVSAQSTLAETVRTMRETDGLSVVAHVKVDDVCSGILSAADEVGAKLIVIGPHRKRLRDVFIGTTAERMVRGTQKPLLVGLQTPSAPYASTLLALNFDQASKTAARAAVDMGIFEHTNVVGMHAFDTPAREAMQRSMEKPDASEAYLERESREAARRLQDLVTDIGLPLEHQRVVAIKGSVAMSILASAQKEDVDLIVLGVNNRKGFERLLIGSVTEDVLRNARRDILIVPVDCAESG